METRPNKKKLLLQFSILYLFSIALVLLIAFYFFPGSSSQTTVSAENPLVAGSDAAEKAILLDAETISRAYMALKESDKETITATDAPVNLNSAAQTRMNDILDSVGRIARSYDAEQSLRLQNFVEAFRLSLSDRSAMNAYKTAMLSSSNTNGAQSTVIKLQAELQAKNQQISALNNELDATSREAASTASADKPQGDAEMTSTIVAQQKKIAALTADIKVLNAEKSRRIDNSETDFKNLNTLNAILEQKVNQLTTDLRIAQADCNITRADASKIISNSRQRKQLLSEALSILNSLAATGDATTKSKVAEKINRLNSVASAMHD